VIAVPKAAGAHGQVSGLRSIIGIDIGSMLNHFFNTRQKIISYPVVWSKVRGDVLPEARPRAGVLREVQGRRWDNVVPDAGEQSIFRSSA
jgi:hypothetical protein